MSETFIIIFCRKCRIIFESETLANIHHMMVDHTVEKLDLMTVKVRNEIK